MGTSATSLPLPHALHDTSSYTVNVHLPKDRISMAHQGYGFCEFLTEEDAEYACKIMNQIKLWGKPIRVNKVIGDFSTLMLPLTHSLTRRRHRRTKNSLTWALTSLLAIWMTTWTSVYSMTPSAHSVSCPQLRRCVLSVLPFASTIRNCLV